MGIMYLRDTIVLAKIEVTEGTDPTPTVGSNAIECSDVKISYAGDVLDRNVYTSSLSPKKPIVGKRHSELRFTCELKASGALGTAPQIGALLQACGMLETVNASTSVVYNPTTSDIKSITLYAYDFDGSNPRLHKITGARGTWALKMEAGQYGTIEFTMMGQYNAPTDVSDPGSPTYESTDPEIVESIALTINSDSDRVVQALEIDIGNDVVEREDVNSASGIKSYLITGRQPTGSINPEAGLVADYDWIGDWAASTSRAMSFQHGASSGEIISGTFPVVSIESVEGGDRNGIRTEELPLRFSRSSGDDEMTLTFI